ncbi:ABC transporter permease [Acidovorax sp. Root402]|uniref:ABC transporter permease n=1 Tax=Acidovorax sp. Root402 TaxID=1736527 RepID=UPI0006F34CF4|nr:ABC transporter permease [Acidovorax sp. Root402]KQW30006.1 ABC transporter permease [Acidovorax sp. Root402]
MPEFPRQVKGAWLAILCLSPGLLFLGALFAAPLGWSLAGSFGLDQGYAGFTLEHYAQIFTRPALLRGLLVSLYYGCVPVAISLVLAIGLALLLRHPFRGRAWFNGLYKIPMAVPGIIAALLVLTLAERGGFLDRLAAPIGLSLPRLVRDPLGLGVIMASVWKQLPFMTLVITGAFAAIPQDVGNAARSLGADRWNTLIRIELPMALPGISAAVLLSFIGTMGAFAIPDLLGPPSPRPLAVHMFAEFGNGNLPLVNSIGMVLSLFSVAVLLAYYALSQRASRLLGSSPVGDRNA